MLQSLVDFIPLDISIALCTVTQYFHYGWGSYALCKLMNTYGCLLIPNIPSVALTLEINISHLFNWHCYLGLPKSRLDVYAPYLQVPTQILQSPCQGRHTASSSNPRVPHCHLRVNVAIVTLMQLKHSAKSCITLTSYSTCRLNNWNLKREKFLEVAFKLI